MKTNKGHTPLWVAVRVIRGYIDEARLFESREAAQRTERRWRARLNPDYDEAAVMKARLGRDLKKKLLASH